MSYEFVMLEASRYRNIFLNANNAKSFLNTNCFKLARHFISQAHKKFQGSQVLFPR